MSQPDELKPTCTTEAQKAQNRMKAKLNPEVALLYLLFGAKHNHPGYNETVTQEGWFYDLGDLNQSVPFVRRSLLRWVHYMAARIEISMSRHFAGSSFRSLWLADRCRDARKEVSRQHVSATGDRVSSGRPALGHGLLHGPRLSKGGAGQSLAARILATQKPVPAF